MKKILVINTVGFDFEGISSVIINYLGRMNQDGLMFDFIAQPDIREEIRETLKLLGNVIIISGRKQNTRGYIAGLNNVLKNKYDVIHIHGNSGTMAIEAFLAKVHHVKKIIVHSHNTECDHHMMNQIFKPIMKSLSTDFLACSEASGKWLYGSKKFVVLNNAIDLERFRFNQQDREECRAEFSLKNEFVIGHIGNFIEQKNHDFLIEVFREFHKTNADSRLLLASDGPLMGKIQRKVVQYGLKDVVIFAGRRKDVERLYCAMDVFVFPSLWEGLPVVILEAQAAGLPCIISTNVTSEVVCTNAVICKNLSDTAKAWANAVMDMKIDINFRNFDLNMNILKNKGFDISKESQKLRRIYLQN